MPPLHMGIPICPICPITQHVMKEPVIDHEGNTYEKSAILQWLKTSNRSPITRNVISASQLIPNRAVVEICSPNNNIQDNVSNCSKCNKTMKVSNYKGNKNPLCYNCRDWACKHCTFINKSSHTGCYMCENPR
uniref:U-box domain-containing protein n=1 Tax=viral metagenome TaxID=1070528 RepID=A0A6C0H4B2_9ZZZZ